MRGIQIIGNDVNQCARIIPAHAGNTVLELKTCTHTEDHPRACGEYFENGVLTAEGVGSSPRMRGMHFQTSYKRQDTRIIPAHAGNTIYHPHSQNRKRDHPRACGEYRSTACGRKVTAGSSPRMRGIPIEKYGKELQTGIIPAHAGNTQ